MEAYSDDDYALISPVNFPDVKGHEPIDRLAERKLEVCVIFTDMLGTLEALCAAEKFGEQLAVRIRLLVPYEVPYVLPLAEPPVPVELLETQIRNLAGRTHLEVDAQIYLCRDRRVALSLLLPPHSVAIIGGRKNWWPSPAQRLARDLERDGHHVIFAELR